ncbi:Short-chain dehydrogenase TIC chloroplastic [Hyphodiscus hymeniophilus]|uniref:Short-chain dehydrogenase TIC chloroplastic n=1 Tax=Hyphodiscus hymeniophilus TaxID=353542 RepID=A0A9P7AY26_9HELO|nr:Short-chain dehydrogenase TIC chloroplastic [Hyphodiscus hymeniophilus]
MTRWTFNSNGDKVVEAFKDRVKGKTSKVLPISLLKFELINPVVITGPGIGGIGAETALSLAAGSPSLLILAGRTESKVSPLVAAISARYPSVSTKFVPLDLASQASVRAAAATISSSVESIDILINNGGIMVCPYAKSEEGIEMQFATNYVGHFLLTNLLVGKLLKGGGREGVRVVNVSSSAHGSGVIRWDDVNFEDGKVYQPWEAYGQSKSALILFSHALATRLKKHGGFSFSLHPGSISSGLQVHMMAADKALLEDGMARAAAAEKAMGREWKMPAKKTMQQGCSTTLIAALDPSIEKDNGAYLDNGDIAANSPPDYLSLLESEHRLWKLSEELVGEKLDW